MSKLPKPVEEFIFKEVDRDKYLKDAIYHARVELTILNADILLTHPDSPVKQALDAAEEVDECRNGNETQFAEALTELHKALAALELEAENDTESG